MKTRFFCALTVLVVLMGSAARSSADARRFVAERNFVRLHVIANSDSPEDQARKLLVRDAVRAAAAPIAAQAASPEEAFALLGQHKGEILRAARAVDPGARVQLSKRQRFPLRVYGDTILPAGDYRALRVILGAGAGRNWWCVIYPDLCAADEDSAKALRAGEPVVFYSSLHRWLFGGGEGA